jgi:hypothetical protein
MFYVAVHGWNSFHAVRRPCAQTMSKCNHVSINTTRIGVDAAVAKHRRGSCFRNPEANGKKCAVRGARPPFRFAIGAFRRAFQPTVALLG